MKRKTIPILFILMLFLPVMGFAIETLSTVYVNGLAPMSIDGNLDDWEEIDVQEVPITNQIGQTNRNPREVITTGGDADLSFSFKCFADARYVYVALMVTDDDIIIGNHDFGEGWKDDSTTICFDGDLQNISKSYFDANDGHFKVIGAPPDGVAYIEGNIPYFYEIQVPYFWESRGIKAGFQQYDTGYNIEAAIPLKVLGWNNIGPSKTMGMNIRVVDMDHDMDVDSVDKGLTWAPDPDHTSQFKTECYNRVVFTDEVSIPGVVKSGVSGGTYSAIGSEARELEIELSTPDYTDGIELFDAAFEDIAVEKWDDAESKLASVQDAIWAQPMLGIVQLKSEKIKQGVQYLHDFAEQCPDEFAVKWVNKFLKRDVTFLHHTFSGERISDNHVYTNRADILYEYFKLNPDDQEAYNIFLKFLKLTEGQDHDLALINKIMNENINKGIYDNAKLALARYSFINGDYQRTTQLAEEIINSDVDSKLVLDARMILLSIAEEKK